MTKEEKDRRQKERIQEVGIKSKIVEGKLSTAAIQAFHDGYRLGLEHGRQIMEDNK